jgi:hypothetical protein
MIQRFSKMERYLKQLHKTEAQKYREIRNLLDKWIGTPDTTNEKLLDLVKDIGEVIYPTPPKR